MLGFAKRCPVCGMDVKKESAVKRFGKHFCSVEHAEKFSKTRISKEKDSHHHGGCC